ncbi:hypothetical protein PsorP6_014167 [Peronosclerospora sorghi]|uniref:Uncharacterized protein n=1 Tax=Peronosclerospora sorghi TaxID=230839 RepID=A0ACC0VGV8_9STRA|nr:hypothetical protein PsorP6_014167 [Peronosclerospora sorghi]
MPCVNWLVLALCGQLSEREAQQILPYRILFTQRALGNTWKSTRVYEGDGERLPLCVIYAVLPREYALALRSLVERAGICALRHASTIPRALLLASESVGDGQDVQALTIAMNLFCRPNCGRTKCGNGIEDRATEAGVGETG